MNSENLLSYIENKEPLDEKAISQIMLLLEKHSYFQLGHMLLLKAMQNTHSEKYNKQLRISGSFISDKKKLFQFINTIAPTSTTTAETNKVDENDKSLKVETPVIEEKAEVKAQVIKTEVKPVIEKTTEAPEKKIEIKKEITVVKAEPEKKEQSTKKKVDLSEEEIERIADENSKIKHKEIIKDFFHREGSGSGSIIEKKVVEPKKTESIQKETAPIEEKKEVIEKKVVKEINFENKDAEKKQETEVKLTAKDLIKKDRTESPSKIKIIERDKVNESKKDEIVDKKVETEKTKVEIPETKKETVVNKTQETKSEDASNDTMSNIFSKIRQIKKEMNISSESTPETIDVNKDEEPSKLVRTKKPEEKRSTGRVIKESFIGFNDETTELNEEEEKTPEVEKDKEEKEEIKESVTAKDLFRQHLKMKERSLYEDSESKNDKTESNISKSPISKLVEIVNEETAVKNETVETEKKETPIETKKEEIKSVTKTEPKKIEGETAADALLRRIAEKKQKIKEEQKIEEQKKEEEQQKELDAVNELIKSSNKPTKIETESKSEVPSKEQTESTEEISKNEEQSGKEKKSNKLIDSFIQKAESLERIGSKETSLIGDISESSTIETDEIMTETYADLLIQQKNYKKAIEVYNKLILKIPEKKTYFAIQIKKVESLIK